MLKELLIELFRPPYDFLQIPMILLIVLFILLTCGMIIFSVHSFCINRKIQRFFSAHEPTSGVVVKYDAIDGDTYVTMRSVVPGQLIPSVLHSYKDTERYIIVLECRVGDTHFWAKYEIPQSDYKEKGTGETVLELL